MNRQILRRIERRLKAQLIKEASGHDWWHVERVRNNAVTIARKEKGADLYVVQLGALLHDVADYKFHNGDSTLGGKIAAEYLYRAGADDTTTRKVVYIVDNVSFKGLGVKAKLKSLEGRIVQDADRLDAIGAIGIARTFAYGGYKGQPIYNPEGRVKRHRSFSQYKKGADSTLHHFYEKLLHLENLMNTRTGKKMAKQRHKFLETYLKQFHAEWNGQK